MNHITALDGVRGVAVLLVLLFHYGLFPAGWVGVQLFFVLSGFLITRILIDSRQRRLGPALKRFYWRRCLRILPVFCLFLIAVAVIYLASGLPSSFGSDWPWLISFAANLARFRAVDIGAPFVHMWSLAVEEQFYLVWPFAVLLLSMRQLRWVVIALLLGVPVLRLVIFEWMSVAGHVAAYAGRVVYVSPVTQFDAFASGAALAIWPNLVRKITRGKLIAILGVVGICGAAVLADNHISGRGAFFASLGYSMYLIDAYGYVWGYSILNLLFTALLACTISDPVCARVFACRQLVFTGRVSYGLYVYHLPLLVGLRFLLPGFARSQNVFLDLLTFAAWVAVSIVVAAFSFHYIERPILGLKDRFFSHLPPR